MIDRNEVSDADLQELHDLYQQRIASALGAYIHIDLTIPSQSRVAEEVVAKAAAELSLLAEA